MGRVWEEWKGQLVNFKGELEQGHGYTELSLSGDLALVL